MIEYIINKIRIQYVCSGIVRIERAACGTFCDENTLVVPDRTSVYSETDWLVEEKDGCLCFEMEGYTLSVPHTGNLLAGIQVTDSDGKTVYRYKKLKNSGELPVANKTPEVFALADDQRVLVPEHGYSYNGNRKDNGYTIEQNVVDIYLILCKKDAKLLRKLYVTLTGRSELVRLSTLGFWDSKYYVYSEQTAKQRIKDYEKHGVPLDNMVIDTDWRQASERGIGYDINTELFPDLKRFFEYAHDRGVNIVFNDHPEPFNGADSVLAPDEVKYREENLQRILALGLDIWWYDRNWSTALKSPVSAIAPETWGMYAFSEITKNYYKKRDGKIHTRPDIMANVNNIYHGSYSGAYGNCENAGMTIADSVSHRYSIQWTGDIASDYRSLAREVGNMLGGGNNCIPYVNADCGGHVGNPDKYEYIRWMQFGTFSPVFRPHCSNLVKRTREPWAYDDETLVLVSEYIRLRYRLLPVIYKEAYESYLNGTPIFRPLVFNYPQDGKAAKHKDEYLLGDNILVAPIAEYEAVVKIPEKNFTSPVSATYFKGTEWGGKPLLQIEYRDLYKYWNRVKPHDEVPVYDFSARYETTLKFDKDVKLFIESDDGVLVYLDGELIYEDKTLHSVKRVELIKLCAGVEYKIRIDYFQGGGDAAIALLYSKIGANNIDERRVYLPQGCWIDAFNGKVYEGKKTIKRKYGIEEIPLFIRLGALIPLAYDAKNTKEQKWDRLVYDFYPCKEACDEGYLYEDDTRTTAYRFGVYRKSRYEARFCEESNAFVVRLYRAEGTFNRGEDVSVRALIFRLHLSKDIKSISRVTVNNEDYNFISVEKDRLAFPLNIGEGTPDGRTVSISLQIEISKEYKIKFYL